MSYRYDKAYEEYGDYVSSDQLSVVSNQEDKNKPTADNKEQKYKSTGDFFGSLGFFGKKGNIKQKYSQEAHKPIEEKVALISSHVFDSLAKKYGKIIQKINVKINPNVNTPRDGLSTPGIVIVIIQLLPVEPQNTSDGVRMHSSEVKESKLTPGKN